MMRNAADSCFQSSSITFAGLQHYRVGEKAPDPVADLVNPCRHLHSMRIGKNEAAVVHAPNWLGEENLDHGILIGIALARIRICSHVQAASLGPRPVH